MLSTILAIFDVATKFMVLCVALVTLWILYDNFWKNQVLLEPILIPSEVTDSGYTGQVLARLTREQINRIKLAVEGIRNEREVGQTLNVSVPDASFADVKDLDVAVPGFGISLKWLINQLKQQFNVPNVVVSGHVVKVRDQFTLNIQIKNLRTSPSAKAISLSAYDPPSLFSVIGETYMRLAEPHILAIYFNKRGVDMINNGRPNEATTFFKDSIAVSPEDRKLFDRSEVYTNWGWAFALQGSTVEAEKKFRKALETNEGSAYTYVTWGRMLSNQHDHEGAAGKFEQAIAVNPQYAYAYVSWANTLRTQKAEEEAIKKCRRSLEIDPRYDYAYVVWGEILLMQEKFAAAAKKFQEAISVNPDYAFAYVLLGRALAEQGDPEAAVANLRKAVSINPRYDYAYVMWGNVLAAQNKLTMAADKYEEALAVNPQYAFAYARWGDILDRKGEYEEAAAKFQKATEVKPDYDLAYVRWGEILARQGADDGAVAKFQKALEVNPKYDFGYLAWGRVLLDIRKEPATAIEKFKKTVEINPQHAEAYSDWGRALALLGDHEGAAAMFRKAHGIDPRFPVPNDVARSGD